MSTIELPNDLAAALATAERGMTIDELATEVLAERFGPLRRTLSFAAVDSVEVVRGGAYSKELLEEGGFGLDNADR